MATRIPLKGAAPRLDNLSGALVAGTDSRRQDRVAMGTMYVSLDGHIRELNMGYFVQTARCKISSCTPENAYPRAAGVRSGLRFYNPSVGRWMSGDPIDVAGGLNLRVFVENAPCGRVDPFGLNPTSDGVEGCCCCCADCLWGNVRDVDYEWGPEDGTRDNPYLVFNQPVDFEAWFHYVRDTDAKGDCKYGWEEWSNKPINVHPGDSQWHTVSASEIAARGGDLPAKWAARDKPCEGSESLSFSDDPKYGWATKKDYDGELKPWAWEHRIRVSIESAPGCPCSLTKAQLTITRRCRIQITGWLPKCQVRVSAHGE